MKLERRSLSRLTVPLRALADRFAFASLLGLSIALLVLSRADVGLATFVNTRIADALTPILAAISQPIEASRRVAEQVGALAAVYEENARLRDQNRRLLEWQAAARQLALENRALRQMLSMDAEAGRPTAVAARVVADAGGPFVHTVLLNAGREHGVAEGMAAVDERGLVGRVIEVGRRSSRLLLLIDFNSRVPVMVVPSRDQAILAGDNTVRPKLLFLPLNPRLSVGDRIVTSGRGGVLPPGLEIGLVSAITDEHVAVTTRVDWDRLEHVRLLEYAPVTAPEPVGRAEDEMFEPPPAELPGARPDPAPVGGLDEPLAASAAGAPPQ